MQPVLSVEQPRRSLSACGVGTQKPAFSLVIEGFASKTDAARSESHDLLLAAARFAAAHQFVAIWPPAQFSESATEQSVASFGDVLAAISGRVELRTALKLANPAAKSSPSPFWVEVIDGTEGFKQAAQMGAHIFAHLLGRSIEAVGKDIALYRRTWTEAGHAGHGWITLVVPALVGEDETVVQTAALAALRDQFRRQPSLMRDAVWDFSEFLDSSETEGITPDEFLATRTSEQLDELVRFAADRSVSTAGLIGGKDTSVAFVKQLKQIGVDELACLVDFGWPTDLALEHLTALNEVRLVFQECEHTNGHAVATTSRVAVSPPTSERSSRNETEKKLAELWSRLLDVSEIGPADNFFDLGGHSLLAARAVSEIERLFGVRPAIKTLMVSPLSQVASEIEHSASLRPAAAQCENAVPDASAAREKSKRGRLAGWFKNARNSDLFQDGSQPC